MMKMTIMFLDADDGYRGNDIQISTEQVVKPEETKQQPISTREKE